MSTPVTLSWGASSGATYYSLGVRDVASGALVVDTNVSGTSYSANLTAGKQYRWNVAACNSTGCSAYTTVVYFQTAGGSVATLSFTDLAPSTITTSTPGYQATLSATGSNFNNVTQVRFSWSGATNNSVTWVRGDSNWSSKVTVSSDTSMTLRPVVTAAGDPAGTTTWTVTLVDNTGATATRTFTVTYTVTSGGPDLLPVPGTLVINPNPVQAGQSLGLSFTVRNQGNTGVTITTTTRVRLSQSPNSPTSSDPLLASLPTPP